MAQSPHKLSSLFCFNRLKFPHALTFNEQDFTKLSSDSRGSKPVIHMLHKKIHRVRDPHQSLVGLKRMILWMSLKCISPLKIWSIINLEIEILNLNLDLFVITIIDRSYMSKLDFAVMVHIFSELQTRNTVTHACISQLSIWRLLHDQVGYSSSSSLTSPLL